jgi:hypothetical protein
VSDQSLTITEFCAAEKLSRSRLYKLWQRAGSRQPPAHLTPSSPGVSGLSFPHDGERSRLSRRNAFQAHPGRKEGRHDRL